MFRSTPAGDPRLDWTEAKQSAENTSDPDDDDDAKSAFCAAQACSRRNLTVPN